MIGPYPFSDRSDHVSERQSGPADCNFVTGCDKMTVYQSTITKAKSFFQRMIGLNMHLSRDITENRIIYYRPGDLNAPIKACLDRLCLQSEAEWPAPFHTGTKETCFHIALNDDPAHALFCKRYRRNGLKQRLVFPFNSPARRAFVMAHLLRDKGVPTPAPICYIRFRKGFHRGNELLCTLWISGSLPFGPFIDDLCARPRTWALFEHKRTLARKLAVFVAAIHRGGIYHGDFNINNILIGPTPEHQLYLIDTADIRTVRGISQRRILKNLDEVNRFFLDRHCVSHTNRLRFLITYLEQAGLDRSMLKTRWRQIQERTMKRLEIHGKRFNP
ncbi:hypothetical protein JXQ70_15040 [bacterium]|nr:hypothetical protein [bacterium]